MTRWGITVPFAGSRLSDVPQVAADLADLGYTDMWSSEVDSWDGVTPLAAIAGSGSRVTLGSAILPVHTRGPAVLAQTAATLAGLSSGTFVLGIGSSAPAVVRDWNALPHDAPLVRVRDTLTFLREAFTGARVDRAFETFEVRGFQLKVVPDVAPPVYVAALRPGMLHLAAAEADGAITNWLSADDVAKVRAEIGPQTPLVARILVAPTEEHDVANALAARLVAAYLNVPTYAAFQRWLGRGPALAEMWDRWAAGDRRGALAAIPGEVLRALVIRGSADEIRQQVRDYVAAGVDVPVIYLLPSGGDDVDHARRLAPTC